VHIFRRGSGIAAGVRPVPRLVLVNVVAVLDVTVAIVDVVNVIAVGDHLAAVLLRVGARVAGVQRLLRVTLVAVHMVDVVVVPDRLAPVARMMLVIDGLSMGRHLSSLPAARGGWQLPPPHRGRKTAQVIDPPARGTRPDSGRR
jgi:hypothetical protein